MHYDGDVAELDFVFYYRVFVVLLSGCHSERDGSLFF